MMMSPNMYIKELENKSYKELLKVRYELINEIKDFENNKVENSIKPSPETMYKVHLQYLSELCLLISNKFKSLK